MANRALRSILATLLAVALVASGSRNDAVAAGATKHPRLSLVRGDREPPEGRHKPSAEAIKALREAVAKKPRDRQARFDLVMGLTRAGKLAEALAAARAWRQRDAYNLVVVRLIGDLYAQLGQTRAAQRAYSAVVELLPKSADAQRALATVMKQAGQLAAAHERLLAAAALAPKDSRIAFELADTAQRLARQLRAKGRSAQAAQLAAAAEKRFKAIIDGPSTPAKIAYPARQRLAQIYAARRNGTRDAAKRRALDEAIGKLAVGGAVNDIKVYLTWDTNRTDVDLWVTNPTGETINYKHKRGALGGALYGDVTDGYGPESFTTQSAAKGTYVVAVNFYGTRRQAFREARGEVVVVLDEGRPSERRFVLPYRLFRPKQTVTVARVVVR
ncbi:MAG: hypothetical protein KC503_27495 [Myxococcales bacterium]|nr:hypothetical protein [Myxococcales bacterium]